MQFDTMTISRGMTITFGAAAICLAGIAAACAEQPQNHDSSAAVDRAEQPQADQSTVTVDRGDPSPGPGDLPSISLSPAFANLTFLRPVQVTHAPGSADGSDRLFVIEQPGRVVVFENRPDVEAFDVFLDIREQVFMGHNEEGLLSIAFHPQFAENGRFYVWYTEGDRHDRRMVLSRFRVSEDNASRADADSEEVILKVDQPWGNHNGGTIRFGPEGYLYLSIGDGGAANDPRNYSQNMQSLLGKIIRIDVDRAGDEMPYSIPADNPFVGREDARGEIWAVGLRNVWRMSFDRETNDLWAADVGQDAWEAVFIITRGGNYGWAVTEGAQPFRSDIELAAETGPMIDPVIEYSHRHGKSITGGYVYRGEANQRLRGAYLYADYVSGRVWAVQYEDGVVTAYRTVLEPSGRRFHVTSFGEDKAGELYVTVFDQQDRRNSPGRVLRVVEY